ncbi:MAG TPA: CBS domain-containing protein [Bdellovibrionota bacterium]|nr:CBS domain-containing protein [Bdellovibrionota bacterium]
MKTAEDLLKGKGYDVFSVSPKDSVFEAVGLMADKNIGSVLVMEGKKLLGIVTERDYARKIILEGKRSRETPVLDIMESKVIGVTPERTIEECMAIMTEERIRHLPVIEGDQVRGIISIGDVVHALISEKQFVIEQLESYITGRP